MTSTIETSKAKIDFFMLPENNTDFEYFNDHLIWRENGELKSHYYGSKKMVLGFLNELTEEQKESVVESTDLKINGVSQGIFYRDYFFDFDNTNEWFARADTSFKSLTDKAEVYLENPIEEPGMHKLFGQSEKPNQEEIEWQAAQERTSNNWLLLVEYKSVNQ